LDVINARLAILPRVTTLSEPAFYIDIDCRVKGGLAIALLGAAAALLADAQPSQPPRIDAALGYIR
jgi:hypothetical protein